ncbi:hypothetical protein BDW69DRAFT_194014 [Aspergillus filifer]
MTIITVTPKPADDSYPYDLGHFTRRITTTNPTTQTWFNRGLTWSYTFNHAEAVKCFEQAIAHDENCAIAYWGLAYAVGPNHNYTWDFFGPQLDDATRKTYEASQKALDLIQDGDDGGNATPIEKALINALKERFASPVPSDDIEVYKKRDRAYADAMGKVYEQFKGEDDLDVAALYADSMMCLTPWKLWDLKTGKPNPGTRTLEAKAVLEQALRHPDARRHPGLLHFYIHLIEMSPTPELGLVAADHLRELVPDSGHACHMPSHLDVLVGDYRAAIRANQRATIADEKYLSLEGGMNFYSNYRMHNYHTLIYAAMFAGQKVAALDAVDRMEKTLPKELLTNLADFVEVYMSVRPHVMIRFGMWEEIIDDETLPIPEDKQLYCMTTAMTYYAKGVAHAAIGNIEEAKKYRDLYTSAAAAVPESRLDFPNRCVDILGISTAMLDGEIAYREADYEVAFKSLSHAVELDDNLGYSEPWSWMQPARHAYAALLLEQNHVEEALAVYKTDLGLDNSALRARQHLGNVWALQGYFECLVRLGRDAEAAVVEPQIKVARAVADIEVKSSCFLTIWRWEGSLDFGRCCRP